MSEIDWPSVNQMTVDLGVDGTPDGGFALRILRAYRQRADVRWEVHGLTEERRVLWVTMNEHQQQRADELDRAIALLESAG